MGIKKLIGNRQFYKNVFLIAVPIMVQNGITNFVALLDNIMVGQLGTEQMSGIAIVNQLLFVFNLCIFGGLAGPGIFGAQFFGQDNTEGIRHTFRFKTAVGIFLFLAGAAVLSLGGEQLISLYLTGEGEAGNKALTLGFGLDYLKIMIIGLIPFVITQVYASTLRETNQTIMPMVAGLAAVAANLVLDWVLIFGKLGAPALGVSGAAIATVISRVIECAIVVIWTHANKKKNTFIVGVFRHIRIPAQLAKRILISGLPLTINECLWSAGMAVLNQCYSRRGLEVVAATNISSTIWNLFGVVFIALGNSVGIIVGQILGSGDLKKARDTDTKLIAFTVAAGVFMGGFMAVLSGIFPSLYNTSDSVRSLASSLILISGVYMPLAAFMHAAYFTLRSGGRTFITFLFDSVYVWAITIPTALLLVNLTGLDIIPIYIICQSVDILKMIIGAVLIKKGIWIKNIVGEKAQGN